MSYSATIYTKPYEHQLEALTLSQDRDSFGLLMEAGTGKTKIIIDTAAHLYAKGEIDTLVVIAPNNVHRNWIAEEVPVHLHPDCPRVSAYYEADQGVRKTQAFESVVKTRGPLRILAFNVEALSTKSSYEYIRDIVGDDNTLLVIDESQRIKSPSSRRTKAAINLANKAAYRRILSGTPVSQGLQDLYSQFRFLDWRIIGSKTYADYKGEFCVLGGYMGTDIVAYRNVERLQSRLVPWSYQKNKRDCLDLPPQTWLTREVELSAEQRKHYKELKKEFETALNQHTLTAPQAGVRMMRLRQILSGFFPHEDGGAYTALPCPRLETCADLVEECSRGKCIVWAAFQADVIEIVKKLHSRGIGAVPYYGGITSNECWNNLQQWRSDPNIVAFVGTPAKGGVGLTMNEADTTVFYSHDYNYETRVQAEARNHRAGQTKPVTYYNLVARGTADVRMLAEQTRKGNVADLIRNMDRKALLSLLAEAA